MKMRAITTAVPRETAENSVELFLEASRLEDLAYGLISQSPVTQKDLEAFKEAKLVASAKYIEAQDARARSLRELCKQY